MLPCNLMEISIKRFLPDTFSFYHVHLSDYSHTVLFLVLYSLIMPPNPTKMFCSTILDHKKLLGNILTINLEAWEQH